MARGTAKFETMKMVDVKSPERKIINNSSIDVDMNDKMRLEDKKDIKLVELDPLRSINKGLDDSIETKGLLDFNKSPILNTLKKVGETKPIKSAAKYGTIGTTGYFTLKPGDVETKAFKVKNQQGIVEEIVERLKTNRE